MLKFTLTMSQEQLARIHNLVEAECVARKNWIASAVELEDYERAHSHVEELRCLQALFAATNVEAKYVIARATDKPIATRVDVADRKVS
jgi:hypothetical protein